MEFYEFLNTGGALCTPYLDGAGAANDSTSSTSQVGIAFPTLTGTNDVIVQGIFGNVVSAISGSYTLAAGAGTRAVASLVTNSGAAPTWTTAMGTAAVNAIAISDGCTVSISPTAPTVYGLQTQQFTANVAVIWSVTSGGGSVNSSGLYTAPAPTGATQMATVTATSAANPARRLPPRLRFRPGRLWIRIR